MRAAYRRIRSSPSPGSSHTPPAAGSGRPRRRGACARCLSSDPVAPAAAEPTLAACHQIRSPPLPGSPRSPPTVGSRHPCRRGAHARRLPQDPVAPTTTSEFVLYWSSCSDDMQLQILLHLPSLATLISATCSCRSWRCVAALSPNFFLHTPPPLSNRARQSVATRQILYKARARQRCGTRRRSRGSRRTRMKRAGNESKEDTALNKHMLPSIMMEDPKRKASQRI
ncbi:hypothetical protein PR202_gb21216 [Eleusine coracana subsp. coracana]|uniref:F-box domain-containing protein n=1 Tax=Eleusine coracana subsp. coracana TaxID=191504 RepID=A0AAV5FAL8_ELECO|nr:hypothetical protein PR202_gb21216 [Eleusine coracana subsp. coracana]